MSEKGINNNVIKNYVTEQTLHIKRKEICVHS